MNLKKIAFVVSRSFDFYTWFPVGLLLAVFNSNLSSEQIWILLPILFSLDVILPISLFLLVLKKKKISDIDVTKREERHKLFAIMDLILLVSLVVAFLFGNRLFVVLNLISFLLGLTMFLVTLKFKISGHLIMNASSIFVINYIFDWKFLWLFLIIPLVAFARIYLKKHTLAEVLAGASLGLLEPYLILRFFNLL